MWLAALERYGKWLAGLLAGRLPFVEGVRRNHAAALLEGLAKGGLAGSFFGAGVDSGVAAFGVLGLEGNQAPGQQRKFSAAGVAVQTHHGLAALRRCVVAGREERHVLKLNAEPAGE